MLWIFLVYFWDSFLMFFYVFEIFLGYALDILGIFARYVLDILGILLGLFLDLF